MKFLFASSHCLDDRSSGAALSMHTLLKGLVREGHSAIALSGMVFDTQEAANRLDAPWRVLRAGETGTYLKDGVRYFVVGTSQWRRRLITAGDEETIDLRYRSLLDAEKPDFVLTYGGMALERSFLAEAKARGIQTVFRLTNPSYPFKFIFDNADHIVTDSVGTAELYKNKLGLSVRPMGSFIDYAEFISAVKAPEYITFVNPSLEKGVALVARLALMARERLPLAKFLIVESRGQWLPSIEKIGLKSEDFPNVTVWPMQMDMRNVYSRTKILLLPSLWHESGSRVAVEALANEIPILVESRGGTKDLLWGSGIELEIPDKVRSKPNVLVDEDDALSWFDTIKLIEESSDFYLQAVDNARKAAMNLNLQVQIRNFLKLFEVGGDEMADMHRAC